MNGGNQQCPKLPDRMASGELRTGASPSVRDAPPSLLTSPAAPLKSLPEGDSSEREEFTVAEVARLTVASGLPDWHRNLFPGKQAGSEAEIARCRDWPGRGRRVPRCPIGILSFQLRSEIATR